MLCARKRPSKHAIAGALIKRHCFDQCFRPPKLLSVVVWMPTSCRVTEEYHVRSEAYMKISPSLSVAFLIFLQELPWAERQLCSGVVLYFIPWASLHYTIPLGPAANSFMPPQRRSEGEGNQRFEREGLRNCCQMITVSLWTDAMILCFGVKGNRDVECSFQWPLEVQDGATVLEAAVFMRYSRIWVWRFICVHSTH